MDLAQGKLGPQFIHTPFRDLRKDREDVALMRDPDEEFLLPTLPHRLGAVGAHTLHLPSKGGESRALNPVLFLSEQLTTDFQTLLSSGPFFSYIPAV